MTLLFVLCIVIGTLFQFLATWPVNYASRIGWGFYLAAAILWALPQLH